MQGRQPMDKKELYGNRKEIKCFMWVGFEMNYLSYYLFSNSILYNLEFSTL